jgi:hypothetical protein
MIASKACAVQIFDVAFSRRICCSRVCRARRNAEAHRHAKALRVPDRHVGAPFARGAEGRQREQIGGDHHLGAGRMQRGHQRAVVTDLAGHGRILQQGPERARIACGRGRADHDVDADRLSARAQHFDRLRQHVVGDKENGRRRFARALDQGHRLRRGGRFVEHRRVGHVHAGQIGDHLLEVQQRLQAALRDLGLIRRVGRVPGRILEYIAQDDVRRMGAVIALADQAAQDFVLAGERTQIGECRRFIARCAKRA